MCKTSVHYSIFFSFCFMIAMAFIIRVESIALILTIAEMPHNVLLFVVDKLCAWNVATDFLCARNCFLSTVLTASYFYK